MASHFKDPGTVPTLIERMRKRHNKSAEELRDDIERQLKAYFDREFNGGARPSRFSRGDDKSVRSRFLFGLSGGIDSSVVTALAVRAVGKDAVLAINMPAHP